MDEHIESLDDLTKKIVQWGDARQITVNSSPLAQSRKTIEEVHELIEAATLENYHPTIRSKLMLEDAIGDVYVTLAMVAELADLTMSQCVGHAYKEIKDRRGHLREDGVFVKEARNYD